MTGTDLTDVSTSELQRRLQAHVAEYDTHVTQISKLLLKIERIKEELSPIIAELSVREIAGGTE